MRRSAGVITFVLVPSLLLAACAEEDPNKYRRRPPTAADATPAPSNQDTPPGTIPNPGDTVNDDTPTQETPAPQAVQQITSATLKTHLDLLASATYNGRGSATAGHNQAAQYVIGEMQKAGFAPANGTSFLQPFSVQAGTTNNVVGIMEGNDPQLKSEYVIVGAHLDHLGQGFPGADDNASGSAAIIAMAKAFAVAKAQIKRSVILIAFSGEELGLIGSRFYVQNPLKPLAQTVFMLNMDMIGYGANRVQIMGIAAADPAGAALTKIRAKYSNITIDTPADSGDRSDHAPFRNAGVPIALFHTGLHANYHESTDTAEKIDFSTMETIAKIAFEMSYYMAMNGQVSTFARSFYASKTSPFAPFDDDYFTAYFNQHGLGRTPDFDPLSDHATMPGQPL